MRRMPLGIVVVALAVFGSSTVAGDAASQRSRRPDRTVQVDCGRGQSIQEALDREARTEGRLTIEISGFCSERVEIRRPWVTLRGTNAATDGITGPADLENQLGLVQIIGATGAPTAAPRTVHLQQLTIASSPQAGVVVIGSEVGLDDVTIRDSVGDGLSVTQTGFVVGNRLTITANGRNGINSRAGSRTFCNSCVLTANGPTGANWGAFAASAGQLSLNNTTIVGRNGVWVTEGTSSISGGSIDALLVALHARRDGHLLVQANAQAAGDVKCEIQSSMTFEGAGSTAFVQTATSATGFNSFSTGCVGIVNAVSATFAGFTQIHQRAHFAAVPPGIVSFNTLNCFLFGTAAKGNTAQFRVGGVEGVPVACQG